VISVFDLFSIGIGPSSSHTVGPMRPARTFAQGLADDRLIGTVARVRAELFGSLGATGHGHGSDRAVILGLEGEAPETVDTTAVLGRVAAARASSRVRLLGKHEVGLADADLVLHRRQSLPYHPNGMQFSAYDGAGRLVRKRTFYSVGGGFVVDETAAGADRIKADRDVGQGDARRCSAGGRRVRPAGRGGVLGAQDDQLSVVWTHVQIVQFGTCTSLALVPFVIVLGDGLIQQAGSAQRGSGRPRRRGARGPGPCRRSRLPRRRRGLCRSPAARGRRAPSRRTR
jgi:Serine dehydratase beta chain